jgi:hypothetical protein
MAVGRIGTDRINHLAGGRILARDRGEHVLAEIDVQPLPRDDLDQMADHTPARH